MGFSPAVGRHRIMWQQGSRHAMLKACRGEHPVEDSMSARLFRLFGPAMVLLVGLAVTMVSAQTQPQNGYPSAPAPALPQNGFPAAQPATPFDSGFRSSYFPELYGSYSGG